MRQAMQAELHKLIAQFAIASPAGPITPWGKGLINDTYVFAAGGQRYVLQRLNAHVFADPARIMTNLARLSSHPVPPESLGLRLPPLVYAQDGLPYVCDAQGNLWRLLGFIPDTQTLPQLESPKQGQSVGRLLGRFHRWAAELPLADFAVVLPGFHDTPGYLARLEGLVEQATPAQTQLAPVLDFIAARSERAALLAEAQQAGWIRLRLTHGDPKLDNILFDGKGQEAVALIDLDTVQPGFIQHDLGDCLRSCCNRRGESGGTKGTRFALGLAAAIIQGYAQEMRDLLSDDEIKLIETGIWTLPFELGVRFLIDHLEGDRYFKVAHRGQNLERARIQFALVADIERQQEAIRAAIARAFWVG